jgi:hypothetical protein
VLTEEESLSRATINKILVRGAQDFHDARQLLLLVFTGENRKSSVQLSENAT